MIKDRRSFARTWIPSLLIAFIFLVLVNRCMVSHFRSYGKDDSNSSPRNTGEFKDADSRVNNPTSSQDTAKPPNTNEAFAYYQKEYNAADVSRHAKNVDKLKRFLRCKTNATCAKSERTVLILGSSHFENALKGHTSGEHIWARSVMHSLDLLGYTYLLASDERESWALYQVVGSETKMVIMEDIAVERCWDGRVRGEGYECIATPARPFDMPVWKLFSFDFWAGGNHPLGSEWQLSPENYKATKPYTSTTYLGYSIENWCKKVPFVNQRQNRVYLLAKHAGYVKESVIDMSIVQTLSQEGVKFVMGGGEPNESIWPDVQNFGTLTQPQFHLELSKSKVLMGLRNPSTSPSPYDALCLGVAFVNPIISYNRENPLDESHWELQQPFLKYVGEPYVYNVHADNKTEVMDAIRRAMTAPQFDRKILAHMTTQAAKERLLRIVNTDWRAKARTVTDVFSEFGGDRVFII
ncbi:hypothetical protein HDU80_008452 [Chytriomyces hyalinus]|nr:hypothetical protein HDU80_008452 [Chytriomyces hyalinus]